MTLATKTKIRQLSKRLGLGEQVVVDRAVHLFARKVEAINNFKKETQAWDKLSDEVWRKIQD